MKKIISGLFIVSMLSLFAAQCQAQIAMNIKNQKKYQREHTPGVLPHQKLKRNDFRNTSDAKYSYETGAAVYQKALKKEKKHTARIAERHIKHPKLNARIKEKDKVGI
jgi:hypothetical protein